MDNLKLSKVTGLKTKNIFEIMIIIFIVVMIILIYGAIKSQSIYDDVEHQTYEYTTTDEMASSLLVSSDYLTDYVRLFIIRGESELLSTYFVELNTTHRRENAYNFIYSFERHQDVKQEIAQAFECSNQLIEIERRALYLSALGHNVNKRFLSHYFNDIELTSEEYNLSSDEKIKRAIELVYSTEYINLKSELYLHIKLAIFKERKEVNKVLNNYENILFNSIIIKVVTFFIVAFIFLYFSFKVIHPTTVLIKELRENKFLSLIGVYEYRYFASIFNYITQKNHINEDNLKTEAKYDKLTGVYNRLSYEEIVLSLYDKPINIGLFIIDIDSFKFINDTYGHDVGDEIIKKVVNAIKYNMRDGDIIARYGGDEFVVIIKNITEPKDKDLYKERFYRINNYLQKPNDGLPKTSISVGCAFSTTGYHSELFGYADKALYDSKHKGRKCFSCYET